MKSQKIKNLLEPFMKISQNTELKSGMLLMTEIMDSMMKVMRMIKESRLIQKL